MSLDRVRLVPLENIHSEYIVKWRNDPQISQFLFSSDWITLESHNLWLKKYWISSTRKEFVIYIIQGDIPIGTIGLSAIDYENKKAEYGIIIGENKYSGKGYAKEASQLILEYAFGELNLNKVFLKVFEDNIRAISMYKTLGFIIEGTLREDVLKNEVYRNVIVMSLLKEEWTKCIK